MSTQSSDVPMLMIIGWGVAEYEMAERHSLVAAVAGLCAESALSGCLAALPNDPDVREWILSFLSSVKRRAAIRTGVLISTSTMSSADLAASNAAGLDDAIIVQDSGDPEIAIELVRAYQHVHPAGMMSIRVWLNETVRGTLQAQVCAWKHATDELLSIELSPFRSQDTEGSTLTVATRAQPLDCEWLRSALTVTASGLVVPCPAHIPQNGHGAHAMSAADMITRRAALLQTAGSNAVCRSCDRLARFVGAVGIESPTQIRPRATQHEPGPCEYQDHVGRDVGSLSPAEREAVLADLVSRIQAANREHST